MKKLANFRDASLSRNEMKEVQGGNTSTFHCSCHGNPGEWYGNYSSSSDVVNAINDYCPNGGSCHAVPNMDL